MRGPGEILLISCYELGHQPVALASLSGFLRAAGFSPACLDLAAEPLDAARVARARLVGLSVPMHTAMRIGRKALGRVRGMNPDAHVCLFGLYATLNAATLFERGADSVIGGEIEGPFVELARALEAGAPGALPGVTLRAGRGGAAAGPAPAHLRRLEFPAPDRSGLPPLDRYARLSREGTFSLAGAVEASRGCRHLCRHCPIPPVYEGRFFVVPREIVLADIAALVARGARHVTFSDPDFLNGPGHTMAVLREAHARHPEITFDVTAKVEHLLKHRDLLDEMAALGCLFVVSAVESLSDEVLRRLDKGHTAADAVEALRAVRAAGLSLRPSLLPFTPWSTADDLLALLEFVERNDLVEETDPVYWSIRLLLPPGSLLLDDPSLAPLLGPFDPEAFCHTWRHPDPRMDLLQAGIARIVEAAAEAREDTPATFGRILRLAQETLGAPVGAGAPSRGGAHPLRRPPRLTESWFC